MQPESLHFVNLALHTSGLDLFIRLSCPALSNSLFDGQARFHLVSHLFELLTLKIWNLDLLTLLLTPEKCSPLFRPLLGTSFSSFVFEVEPINSVYSMSAVVLPWQPGQGPCFVFKFDFAQSVES